VLVERLFGVADHLTADVTLVTAKLMTSLQMAPHVVSFVGDVLTQSAGVLALPCFDRIGPDKV